MANCTYCNKPAGLLKKFHKECADKYQSAKATIQIMVDKFLKTDSTNELKEEFYPKLSAIAVNNFLSSNDLNNIIVTAWEREVDSAFDDGLLSEEEENHLLTAAERLGVSDKQLNSNQYYQKLIKGAVLRELMEGKMPERIKIGGDLNLNFQKDETIIWLFQNVDYLENRTRRQYVGGYQGVSLKIMKGVYYRAGGFKGNPIDTVETVKVDNGILCTTSKHIYFKGASKGFKLPYKKILSLTPYSDGVGIQKDGVSSKPQSFITNDGWFTYNLLTNLMELNK